MDLINIHPQLQTIPKQSESYNLFSWLREKKTGIITKKTTNYLTTFRYPQVTF